MSLTFKKFKETNLKRASKWHNGNINEWSINDWMVSLCGEVGEAANICKKLKRLEHNYASKNDKDRQINSKEQAIIELGAELADCFCYLDIVATRAGINLEKEIINKFNSVSAKYGFDEKL